MLKYRPDIDGLRALAVSAVVAFHAGLPWLDGGFAGVDVFFVISGFLITGLLLSEHTKTGKIDLPAFWTRRARRLAPAFLFFIIAVLVAAPFTLQRISGETGALARAAIASILINANHYFLSSSGEYFGAAAETNPLLHLWSLSVEEQFYLAWPLVLAMLWRTRSSTSQSTRMLMAAITLGSFLGACWLTMVDSKQAFYLMPARAWELVAGGLMALLLQDRGVRRVDRRGGGVGFAGLLLLLGSFVFLDGTKGFPGPTALFPVAGTLLLLLGGYLDPTCRVSRSMGARWVVYLGKISYPLYLWHWPVLVLFRSNRLYESSPPLDALAVVISIILAVFTYEVVEKGLWKSFTAKPRIFRAQSPVVFALAGVFLAMAIGIGIGAWARFGWAYNDDERRLDAARRDLPPLDCMFQAVPDHAAVDRCMGDTSKPTILLLGDSHANHWRPALTAAAHQQGVNLATLTMNACRPLSGPVGTSECMAFNSMIREHIGQWREGNNLVGVVISARWPEGAGIPAPSITDAATWRHGEYFDQRAQSADEALRYLEAGLEAVAASLASQDIRLLVIGPSPVQRFAAVHCLALRPAKECGVSRAELTSYVSPTEDVIREVAAKYPNVRFLDPLVFMCNPDACPVLDGQTIMFSDDDHLTRSYTISQASKFADVIAWMTSRGAPRATSSSQGSGAP
ncbi:MAG: acyltransferase family protein [Dokdonella sp.]